MLRSVYTYYLIIIFFLFALQACRQQPVDQNVAGKTHIIAADTLQANRLIDKGKVFENSNVDSLPPLVRQLRRVSGSNNKKGFVYAEVFEAYYYWLSANYAHAMQICLKALSDAEKWKINEVIPGIYSVMANLHKETGNYNAAFNDNTRGLTVARLNHDTASIISLLGLKAMFIHGYYRTKDRADDDQSSLKLEFEALQMAESQPLYEQMRIRFYNNIAQTYDEQKEYDKAIFYGNKAVVLANKYHQPRSLTYSYSWLGESYYYMGQHDKGITYLNNALAITRQIALPFRQMELHRAMYQCYLSTKNYKQAIASLTRWTEMRDSMQIAKNGKQISELQLKYETIKKDKQIAFLNAQNKEKSRDIAWVLIALFLFVVLLIIIVYQYFIIHKNNKLIKTNNQALNDALLKIAHIQSHRVRKPVASIMGLMNVIKANSYQADKDVLMKMDSAALELDQSIRDVIIQTEV